MWGHGSLQGPARLAPCGAGGILVVGEGGGVVAGGSRGGSQRGVLKWEMGVYSGERPQERMGTQ